MRDKGRCGVRIGVISDTHIPRRAKNIPQEALKHFKDVDMIIHAGDLTDLGVLDELRAITPKVFAVIGNMDPSVNQSILPPKKLINIDNLKIGIMHGWGAPFGLRKRILNEFKQDKPDVIIFGHSHQPEKTIENGVLFLNPGSPTDTVFASTNSIAILSINNKKPDAEIIIL